MDRDGSRNIAIKESDIKQKKYGQVTDFCEYVLKEMNDPHGHMTLEYEKMLEELGRMFCSLFLSMMEYVVDEMVSKQFYIEMNKLSNNKNTFNPDNSTKMSQFEATDTSVYFNVPISVWDTEYVNKL